MTTRLRRLSTALLVAGLLAPALAGSQALAAKPPKIGEVDYFKEKGAQGPDTELEVFGKRIEALKIKASYGGKKATATAREFTHVDDNRWGHPWIPGHDQGRRKLLNVMKASIAATGAVTLKLNASNDAGRTREAVSIVYSDCHLEPPIYPFTCIVEL
jgi:hypothetical protein